MGTHGGWTADVVLARILSPKRMMALIQVADAEAKPSLRGEFAKDFPRDPEWGPCAFLFDMREGRRHLRVARLRLADGVTYSSRDDRSYSNTGWGSDDPGSTSVVFEACLKVTGTTPPETVLDALVGRHALAVIDHPALADHGLTVTWAGLDGRTDGWTGFSALVETVIVPVDAGE